METIVKTTFESSECLVYTRVVIILIILLNVRHGDSSGNETKYVRPGEGIELVCPYRKTVNNTPQWMFKTDKEFATITDYGDVNPIFQNLSFTIVQNKLNETFNLKIPNTTCQHEGTYMCTTGYKGTAFSEMFFVYLKKAPEDIIVVNSVSQNTSTINITENAELTLSCYSGDGIPKATVYWSNNTEDITLNSNETEWSNISLTASRKNDRKNFTCTVVHEMLTYPLTKSVILNVFYIGLDHTEIAVVVKEYESPIVIYLVVCCCSAVLVATTAELYSCWKSGKLRKCEFFTVWTPPRRPNQEMEMNMADVDHYTEIDF